MADSRLRDEPGAGDRSPINPAPRVYLETSPAGGWVVRLEDHPVPISRHDTEEEAESRAAAYRRGLERAGSSQSAPSGAAARVATAWRRREDDGPVFSPGHPL